MDGFITYAYIDPGTGSMLFTLVIGLLSTGVFFMRSLGMKIKFALSGGKAAAKAQGDEKPDYVIFSDSKRYWNVFKPICDEFEKRGIDLVYYTASEDDPVLTAGYQHVKGEFIGTGNRAFARLNLMKAKICLSTTPGLDVLQWKRSKDVDYYVHVYHAMDEGLLYRMFGVDFYDAVLLTGELQGDNIRKLEALRHQAPKDIAVTGCTYMDALKEKADKVQRKETDEKLILLAPSWGESSILNKYGEKLIDALIKTGYMVVVRPHPQMATSDPELLAHLKDKYPDGEKFSWNADNDNFDILSKADIMITDFSAISFDYSLVFDRPLIYADTHIDLAPYDAAWIDEPLWRFEVLPKLGVKLDESQFEDMKQIIDSVTNDDKYRQGRAEVKATIWQCMGQAAEKTVDYLVAKNAELGGEKTDAE